MNLKVTEFFDGNSFLKFFMNISSIQKTSFDNFGTKILKNNDCKSEILVVTGIIYRF